MKIAALLLLALVSSVCASAKPPVAVPVRVAAATGPTPAARLADAQAWLRLGCLDCLHDAYRTFDTLRQEPLVAEDAVVGAIQAAALIALRERGLGMSDSGFLQRARALTDTSGDLQLLFNTALEVIEATPPRVGQVVADEAPVADPSARGTTPLGTLQQHRARWLAVLGATADEDVVSASLWVAFSCTNSPTAAGRSPAALLAPLTTWRDAPIVIYEMATCGRLQDAVALEALVESDARFHEADYWLGFRELSRLELDGAQQLLERAYQWHPQWPSVAVALAGLYMSAEEFAAALNRYDQALALLPGLVDALVGRVRALSFLERFEDAIAGTSQFLKVLPQEAYYWRAWNKNQLQQIEPAWTDILQADRFGPNSEVSKLGGLIAYQRGELTTARDRFETARQLNPKDCDASFYLGGVQAELRSWIPSAEAYLATGGCLEDLRTRLVAQIAVIEASNAVAERKAHRVASRQQRIAQADRMLRQSWFNLAANYFNVGRSADARLFAERVINDAQFGERARALLSELKP